MNIFQAAKPTLLLGVLETGRLEHRVMRLLDDRMPWARRGRVASAVACVLVLGAASVGTGAFGTRVSLAQQAALLKDKERFEVASVRLFNGDPQQGSMSNNQPLPYPANRVTMRYITLKGLVNEAYGYQYEIKGGPEWVDQQHYDLSAKVPGDAMLSEDQIRPMMKNLLAERFHLKYHFVDKFVPGYALTVAKGGAKLQSSKGDSFSSHNEYYELKLTNASVKNFGEALAAWQLKQPVVDKTEIQGQYDIDLKFVPEQGIPLAGSLSDPKYASLPDIFTAVQKQLGLKLVPQSKVTIHTLVIDSANRLPTEN